MSSYAYLTPPWWFCSGWWSPWCVVDKVAYDWLHLARDKERWFDHRHMGARERWEKRHSQLHEDSDAG